MSDAPAPVARWVRERRSVRRFLPNDIPSTAEVASLLEAATWAPSGHNRQPWRFAVLLDTENKAKLAEAMGLRLRADRLADGANAVEVEADANRSYARLTQSPVVVLMCLTLEEMDRYPDERRAAAEKLMAVQSVAMAGQNLMLAAHAAGWGSCWMCAPLFAPEEVRLALGLPDAWEPQGAILLGKPVVQQSVRPRRPVEEVVRWG
ncbi:MAG: nitroreductase family protein [Anaerolineales bacterium]